MHLLRYTGTVYSELRGQPRGLQLYVLVKCRTIERETDLCMYRMVLVFPIRLLNYGAAGVSDCFPGFQPLGTWELYLVVKVRRALEQTTSGPL
jgi:hypothetical protein